VTSLVLPLFNAGTTVTESWRAVRAFVDGQPDKWEAIFVCDGCTDGCDVLLQEHCEQDGDSSLRVIGYSHNRGKGHAVRTGLAAARGQFRLFTDIDLAYSFDDIRRVAGALHRGAAVAIASREHHDSVLTLTPDLLGYAYRRRLKSQIFRRLTRVLLPIRQPDTQAGLKGMTAEVATRLLPVLRCDGFGFDCELLAACGELGIAVEEVPVAVRMDSAASTTGGAVLRMLRELWQIRRGRSDRRAAIAMPAAPLRKAA
jgi:dolichyl-phosphate beta-glucosyltransferase